MINPVYHHLTEATRSSQLEPVLYSIALNNRIDAILPLRGTVFRIVCCTVRQDNNCLMGAIIAPTDDAISTN